MDNAPQARGRLDGYAAGYPLIGQSRCWSVDDRPDRRDETMPGFDDLKKMADDHEKQVDEGIDKAGDAAGKKFGHEDQIDKAADAAQQRTGSNDDAK